MSSLTERSEIAVGSENNTHIDLEKARQVYARIVLHENDILIKAADNLNNNSKKNRTAVIKKYETILQSKTKDEK